MEGSRNAFMALCLLCVLVLFCGNMQGEPVCPKVLKYAFFENLVTLVELIASYAIAECIKSKKETSVSCIRIK